MLQRRPQDRKSGESRGETKGGAARFIAGAGPALGCALSLVLSAGVLAALLFTSGRLPLRATAPVLQATLEQAVDGEVTLEGWSSSLDQEGFVLRLDALTVDGTTGIDARFAEVAVAWNDVLHRRLSLSRVKADDLSVTLGRNEGGGPPLHRLEDLIGTLADGHAGLVRLPSFDVAFARDPSRSPMTLRGGALQAGPAEDGYRIDATLPFLLGGDETLTALSLLIDRQRNTSVSFRSDGTPLDPLLKLAAVDVMELDGRVLGEVEVRLDPAGQPRSGSVDLTVLPGTGRLTDRPFTFGKNRLQARFMPGQSKLELASLRYDVEGNRGELEGLVEVQNLDRPSDLILDFDVDGEGLHVDLGTFLEGPLDLAHVRVKGGFDAARRHVAFDELVSSYFGSELRGSLALTFPEGFDASPRLEADAELPGPLSTQEVLAGWPRSLAGVARTWVAGNLTEGELTNLAYKADIPMGAIRPATPLADDTMRFTFDASDATVQYLPGMPPLEALEASAVVRGNSFEIGADSGTVAGVRIGQGRLDMPRFVPGGATASFDAELVGPIPTILRGLESAGLVSFAESTYKPEVFRGRGQFDLSVAWPMTGSLDPRDVRVSGSGAFSRGAIDDVLPGIDATDADGKVELSGERLVVTGHGLAASAPATFEWRQMLQGDRKADLSVNAELDTVAADMIGLPLRKFFRGTVATSVFARDLTPGEPLEITADITDAAVEIGAFGLTKPQGVKGFLETTLNLPDRAAPGQEQQLLELTSLRINAPSFNIEGSGTFTTEGAVRRLELPRFFIDERADLSMRLVAGRGRLDVDVVGQRLDASPVLDGIFSSSGPKKRLPGRSKLDIELAEVGMRNGVELKNVRLDAEHSGAVFEQLTLLADLGEGEVMSATIDRPPGQEIGYLELEATEFATLLNAVFGITSVTGAPGSLKGTLLEGSGFRGRFEMGELLVRDAPTLALVLGATSLDGLSDLLNGEGIRFQKLEGDIWMKGSRIGFGDTKLVGSAVGMSASGVVDLEAGTIDVRGAVAPAYAVNSFLGGLPGIGRLFVNREGEGVVAFSYQITGPVEEPTVTVNALSALTPGILRRIFEPLVGGPGETGALLDEAIAAARQHEEMTHNP